MARRCVALTAEDRAGLEHLIRYALRPPLAHTRLKRLPSGRIRYQLKRPWYDGVRWFDPLRISPIVNI